MLEHREMASGWLARQSSSPRNRPTVAAPPPMATQSREKRGPFELDQPIITTGV
jgi:hypothetical protein